MIESKIVSTTDGFTKNSPISPSQSMNVKKPSASKSLCQFLESLDIKHKNDVHRLGAAKSKHKAIRARNNLCSRI